jgi:hypothetical protein
MPPHDRDQILIFVCGWFSRTMPCTMLNGTEVRTAMAVQVSPRPYASRTIPITASSAWCTYGLDPVASTSLAPSASVFHDADLHFGHRFGGQSRFAVQVCPHLRQSYVSGALSHLYVPHWGHLRGFLLVEPHVYPHRTQVFSSKGFIHTVDLHFGQLLGTLSGFRGFQ